MTRPPQTPDPARRLAVAMQWVSVVTTIGMEMALPALLGSWLDRRWKTSPWCVVAGAVLGFAVGLTHLLQLARGRHGPGARSRAASSDSVPLAGSKREREANGKQE